MNRMEEMKLQVAYLEHTMSGVLRKIDKAVGAGQKIVIKFSYKEYLRYFNKEYLEEQIYWWFIDNEDESYETGVRFEENICFVEIVELYNRN